MDLVLNVYEKKQVQKRYTANAYDLMFGTVEDLLDILQLENFSLDDNSELIKLATKVVHSGMDVIKPLLKDIFEGLTDEELRRTKVSEIVAVLIAVVRFAMFEIGKGAKGKN